MATALPHADAQPQDAAASDRSRVRARLGAVAHEPPPPADGTTDLVLLLRRARLVHEGDEAGVCCNAAVDAAAVDEVPDEGCGLKHCVSDWFNYSLPVSATNLDTSKTDGDYDSSQIMISTV